jgi:hypothetical protein
VGEGRTAKTAAAEMRASVHATELRATGVHSSSHSTMHSTPHSAMHSTPHATAHATSHSAAMSTSAHPPAAAATKGRRDKSKRCGKGARNEAIKDLVVHPNSSLAELQRRFPSQLEDYEQSQMIQYFQMTNVTVSDTKISFSRLSGGELDDGTVREAENAGGRTLPSW